MKKYILLTVDRYQALQRQRSTENQTTKSSFITTPVTANSGLETTGIPPGLLKTNEPIDHMSLHETAKAGPQLSSTEAAPGEDYKPTSKQGVQPFANNHPTEQDIPPTKQRLVGDLESARAKQQKKLQLKAQKKTAEQKKRKTAIKALEVSKKQQPNELSSAATAGRHKQFWLKP